MSSILEQLTQDQKCIFSSPTKLAKRAQSPEVSLCRPSCQQRTAASRGERDSEGQGQPQSPSPASLPPLRLWDEELEAEEEESDPSEAVCPVWVKR